MNTPKRPLFIYDCNGTLEAPIHLVYEMRKERASSAAFLSLPDFQAFYEWEPKLMLDGMSTLVRQTATVGDNVLLSVSYPLFDASRSLKNLFSFFKNWQYNGQDVPFGSSPSGTYKTDPEVAIALHQHFNPSSVIVIGDSAYDAKVAENIGADILLLRTKSDVFLTVAKRVPHKYTFENAHEVSDILRRHNVLPQQFTRPIQPRPVRQNSFDR